MRRGFFMSTSPLIWYPSGGIYMEKVDLDFSLEAVPNNHRSGFGKILVVMLGLTFFSASMWSGGELGQGLSFMQFLVIVLIGNLILGLYTGARSEERRVGKEWRS